MDSWGAEGALRNFEGGNGTYHTPGHAPPSPPVGYATVCLAGTLSKNL